MIRIKPKLLGIAIACFSIVCTPKEEAKPVKPNIILILADDADYADFGFMGSDEIPTSHLDNLAKDGVIFTDVRLPNDYE